VPSTLTDDRHVLITLGVQRCIQSDGRLGLTQVAARVCRRQLVVATSGMPINFSSMQFLSSLDIDHYNSFLFTSEKCSVDFPVLPGSVLRTRLS